MVVAGARVPRTMEPGQSRPGSLTRPWALASPASARRPSVPTSSASGPLRVAVHGNQAQPIPSPVMSPRLANRGDGVAAPWVTRPAAAPSLQRANTPTYSCHMQQWRPRLTVVGFRGPCSRRPGTNSLQNPGNLCTRDLVRSRKTRVPRPGESTPPSAVPGDSLEPSGSSAGLGRRGQLRRSWA